MPSAPDTQFERVMERLHHYVLTLALILGNLSLFLIAGILVLSYLHTRHRADSGDTITVTSVEPAGRVANVTLSTGWLARTLVQTDLGFFATEIPASLQRDEAVTLETRGDTERYLCDARHRCVPLL
jgi:hypothetical protein